MTGRDTDPMAGGQGASLAPRRIRAAPAVQALLLQGCAFPLALIVLALLVWLRIPLNFAGAALVQGGVAALLTRWRQLARWWLPIQLLFPLALWAALQLHLPPWLFLAAFLVLLALYWSTFRTQVPYFPSRASVWDEVDRQLPQRALRMIDIGSGLGGLVLELARRRPLATCEGIELAPLPWLASVLRARLAGSRARFLRGDYERLDLGQYDAVFAYLSPVAMGALWRKACAEMRPGSMLLSYEFDIPGHLPDLDVVPTGGGPSLYIWHF